MGWETMRACWEGRLRFMLLIQGMEMQLSIERGHRTRRSEGGQASPSFHHVDSNPGLVSASPLSSPLAFAVSMLSNSPSTSRVPSS